MSKETHDFVTYKVPGIPNGTVLKHYDDMAKNLFTVEHTDETGIRHIVEIPVTAAALGAHVRTVKRKEGA